MGHATGAPRADRLTQARAILDENWTGSSTIPAPGLYPHQWNWDTGFIAIGRARWDRPRAEAEMLSLFRGQWANGMLPHIVFNPAVPTDAYFPGPDFWQSDGSANAPNGVMTSGLTQPPVHAFAALEMHRCAANADADRSRGFLRQLFPALAALHRYLRDERSGPEGLAFILHPWESGLDNSPAWDEAFGRVHVPEGTLPAFERRDLMNADPRDRPSDEDYDRFVYLSIVYRDTGYDDVRVRELTPFLVESPMFNAIRAWSAAALVEIAGIVGEDGREFAEDGERIVRAIEAKLWEQRHARFFPFDLRDGHRMNHHSIDSFMPLVAPGLDAELARRTVDSLRTYHDCAIRERCFLLPTYDPLGGDFDMRRYWRGPIWANTNWLLERGCRLVGEHRTADELRGAVFELVGTFGFREYFDPHGTAAYGADRFSWTAALFLDLAARLDEAG